MRPSEKNREIKLSLNHFLIENLNCSISLALEAVPCALTAITLDREVPNFKVLIRASQAPFVPYPIVVP